MKYEIKTPGFFGKVVYIYENNYVKEPGFFGKTIYKVDENRIKEPGFFGKTIYIIDGNNIKEPKYFGKIIYTIRNNAIYQGRELLYNIVAIDKVGKKANEADALINLLENKVDNTYITTEKEEPKIKVGISAGYVVTYDKPEYNQLLAYKTFFEKHRTVKDPSKQENYSSWALSCCGVENPKKLHKELFNNGFYSPANIKDTLNQFKLSELKECAKSLNISIKGCKKDIINQISQNARLEDINNYFDVVYFSVNTTADDFIKEHQIEYDYYDLDDETISLQEYINKRKNFSKNDLKWQSYQNELKNDTIRFGRNAYHEMFNLLYEEKKYKDALLCLLRILFLDFNDIENYYKFKKLNISKNDELIADHQIFLITSYDDVMEELKDYFDSSMVDEVYKMFTSSQSCSKELFKEIIYSMFKGTFKENMIKYEKILSKAFRNSFN